MIDGSRWCYNCKYRRTDENEEPCRTCDNGHSNYTEPEVTKKENKK